MKENNESLKMESAQKHKALSDMKMKKIQKVETILKENKDDLLYLLKQKKQKWESKIKAKKEIEKKEENNKFKEGSVMIEETRKFLEANRKKEQDRID